MPKIKYVDIAFRPESLATIEKANAIISEYATQGFALTLRQLYYQFVARALIPNKQSEYKKLGSTVNDARLAGLIDWNHITDRTRNLRSLAHWDDPSEIVSSAAKQYRRDRWETQRYRPEVWIEKDALIGVIEGVCEELDVPYFSCRGYTSQSEVWGAGMRLRAHLRDAHEPKVFHLGDHDPSGLDMTRDITDRLGLFVGEPVSVRRLALNMGQVDKYHPPPNPAKTTDSRYEGYIAEHGDESWELDALEPAVIVSLIRDSVLKLIDKRAWGECEADEERERRGLTQAAERWDDVAEFLLKDEEA